MKIFKNFKCFKSTIVLLFALALLSPLSRAHAQAGTVLFTPVTVLYLIKDSDSQFGYKEKLRWSINTIADWDRFYKTMLSLPLDKSVNPDPLKSKTNDLIILSRKDSNQLTGFDIYISPKGIMAVHRDANHQFFPDTNKLWDFLKEEQKKNASFETFSNQSKISPKTLGIVTTYNINQNIPNPVWLVDTPDKIAVYDSFFVALKPYTPFELQFKIDTSNFDNVGTFILNMNYPKAPASLVTVTQNSIRLSTGVINTKFYQDTEDYYNFYKSQAREMLNYNERFGDKLKSVSEREF